MGGQNPTIVDRFTLIAQSEQLKRPWHIVWRKKNGGRGVRLLAPVAKQVSSSDGVAGAKTRPKVRRAALSRTELTASAGAISMAVTRTSEGLIPRPALDFLTKCYKLAAFDSRCARLMRCGLFSSRTSSKIELNRVLVMRDLRDMRSREKRYADRYSKWFNGQKGFGFIQPN